MTYITKTAYLLGRSHASAHLGLPSDSVPPELTKSAGIRDALHVALTGRVPLRHGTSSSIAKLIKEEGLQPGASKGISELVPDSGLAKAQEGMAFLTRSKPKAKSYAAQQAGIDAKPKVTQFIDKYMPESVSSAWNDMPEINQARFSSYAAPFDRSVVEARIPREYINKAETMPVEPGRALSAIKRQLPNAHSAMGKAVALPFMSDVVLKGGVPTKYIKGAPDYSKVTLPELKQHFQSIKADPKGYVKDVGRALTGISHRPSKILKGPLRRRNALRFLEEKPMPAPQAEAPMLTGKDLLRFQ